VTSPRAVSLFLPDLAGGGAQRVMANVANGLAGRGHRVDMVLLQKVGPYLSDLVPAVRVVDLHAGTVRSGVYPLVGYLRSVRPDILLSALDYANVGALIAGRLARVPTRVVPTVHIAHSRVAAHDRNAHYAVVQAAMRLTYPGADAIVAVSQGAAEDMIRHTRVPQSLVRVIYNPVITPMLLSSAGERPSHPWFASGEAPVVVAMGRLTAQKDFPTLLRAVAALREKQEVRLLILGEGEERDRLEETVRQLDLTECVSLPGFIRDPFAYLAHASLFVLSSAWEALPTVLIEALALGVPVVSTDCVSGPAEILRGGRYGRLVPVGDAQAMAEAIRKAVNEPRPVIPAAVLRPYTLDAAIDRYENLVVGLCRR
jgi:glycosyltransferase involved in cell wall biosynthesis